MSMEEILAIIRNEPSMLQSDLRKNYGIANVVVSKGIFRLMKWGQIRREAVGRTTYRLFAVSDGGN